MKVYCRIDGKLAVFEVDTKDHKSAIMEVKASVKIQGAALAVIK